MQVTIKHRLTDSKKHVIAECYTGERYLGRLLFTVADWDTFRANQPKLTFEAV